MMLAHSTLALALGYGSFPPAPAPRSGLRKAVVVAVSLLAAVPGGDAFFDSVGDLFLGDVIDVGADAVDAVGNHLGLPGLGDDPRHLYCKEGEYFKPHLLASGESCEPCPPGEWSSVAIHKNQACSPHDRCVAGEYTAIVGSGTAHPVCTACADGTFKAGASTSSTEVESCDDHTVCNPGELLSGASQSTSGTCSACPTDQYQDEISHREPACKQHTTCSPGNYLFGATGATGGSCKSCLPTTYYDTNSGKCLPHTVCVEGQYVANFDAVGTQPSNTQNRHCAGCPANSFSMEQNSPTCSPHTTCAPPNRYVANFEEALSSTTNRKCARCPGNQISETQNAESCITTYDFSTFKGKWVLAMSNAEGTWEQSMSVSTEDAGDTARGIERGLQNAEEAEDGFTVGIVLGSEREEVNEAQDTLETEDCRDTTVETEERYQVGAKASAGAFGVSVEVSAEYENTKTNTEETHKCSNSNTVTGKTDTDQSSVEKEQGRSENLMKSMTSNLANTVQSTISEMKSTTYATSKTITSMCGSANGKGQHVWQWVVDATRAGNGSSTVQIPTDRFTCVGNANKAPMCPPENCGDAECTCCNSDKFMMPWMRGTITLCECLDDHHIEIKETFDGTDEQINDCDGAVIRGYCHADTIPTSSAALSVYSPAALVSLVMKNCPCTCAQHAPTTTTSTFTTTTQTATTATTQITTAIDGVDCGHDGDDAYADEWKDLDCGAEKTAHEDGSNIALLAGVGFAVLLIIVTVGAAVAVSKRRGAGPNKGQSAFVLPVHANTHGSAVPAQQQQGNVLSSNFTIGVDADAGMNQVASAQAVRSVENDMYQTMAHQMPANDMYA